VVVGFYSVCVIDAIVPHSPADYVRRPVEAGLAAWCDGSEMVEYWIEGLARDIDAHSDYEAAVLPMK
jgi:hypothetical protein